MDIQDHEIIELDHKYERYTIRVTDAEGREWWYCYDKSAVGSLNQARDLIKKFVSEDGPHGPDSAYWRRAREPRSTQDRLDVGETVEITGPRAEPGTVVKGTDLGDIEIVEILGKPCKECGGIAPSGHQCSRCGVGPGLLENTWSQKVRRPGN